MASYIIRAALDEETNDGWVWMALPSRTVVRIRCDTGAVFCQVRKIDKNFLKKYNDPAGSRIRISNPDETIVMAEWYRNALGGFGTTAADNKNDRQELDVKQLRRWGWSSLRAACYQPNDVVRLGTRLGVLGAWLGIVGLMPPALSVLKGDDASNKWILLAIALLSGILLICACRGPRRPSPTKDG